MAGEHRHNPADDGQHHVTLCGESVPHAGHVCAFFDSRAQKYDILTPFLKEGIDAGDRVINIVDAAHRDAHVRQLTDAGVPVDAAIATGQLQLSTSEETYLQDGLVNLDGMLELVSDTIDGARRHDQCVRTCGEMNWIGRTRLPIHTILSYEARVNHLVPLNRCVTLLCVYDLAETPTALVSDILATHPFAIIKGRFRRNEYYVQPEEYLQMLKSRYPH
jgi:hypothetical protein